MAMHSPPTRLADNPLNASTPSTPTASAPTSADANSISEARLNRCMESLHTKRANLKKKVTPATGLSSDRTSMNEEECRQLAQEAERQACEAELSAYLSEGCLPASTEAGVVEILNYWRVRIFSYQLLLSYLYICRSGSIAILASLP